MAATAPITAATIIRAVSFRGQYGDLFEADLAPDLLTAVRGPGVSLYGSEGYIERSCRWLAEQLRPARASLKQYQVAARWRVCVP